MVLTEAKIDFNLIAVMVQWHKCETINTTVVGTIATWRKELFNIFISSGNQAKPGVEFRKIKWKEEDGVFLCLLPSDYQGLCGIRS